MYYEECKMDYNFTTERLIVKEWRSFEPAELDQPDLVTIVEDILVPEVTNTFPVMWQGNYDKKRTKAWIEDRNSECKSLLAVDKETKTPIGIINFFKVGAKSIGRNREGVTYLRLGYLLSKAMWDKGFATEFVEGFVHWCKENDIAAILAAVDPDNIASIRVLEKNKFLTQSTDSNGIHLLFAYDLMKS